MVYQEMPNVAIIMARCCRTKQSYGIRFEEQSKGRWIGDWAFELKEAMGKKEGYDRIEVKGTIEFSSDYPGCPHCENRSMVKCSCRKVGCWDSVSELYTCPYCEQSGKLEGSISELEGGEQF